MTCIDCGNPCNRGANAKRCCGCFDDAQTKLSRESARRRAARQKAAERGVPVPEWAAKRKEWSSGGSSAA